MSKLFIALIILLNVSTIIGEHFSETCARWINNERKRQEITERVTADLELEKELEKFYLDPTGCPEKGISTLPGATVLWPDEAMEIIIKNTSIKKIACTRGGFGERRCKNSDKADFYAYRNAGITTGPATMVLLAIVLMIL